MNAMLSSSLRGSPSSVTLRALPAVGEREPATWRSSPAVDRCAATVPMLALRPEQLKQPTQPVNTEISSLVALRSEQCGDTLTISVRGILDFRAYREFRACYEQPLGRSNRYIVDLGRCNHIDSSGFAMLLLLRDYAGGNSGVELRTGNTHIRAMLRGINFDTLFRVTQ